MSRRARAFFAGTMGLAVVLSTVPSLSYPDETPTVILTVGERSQTGVKGSFFEWTGPTSVQGAPPGESCALVHGDAFFPEYPSPRRAPSRSPVVSIGFETSETPTEVSIRGWTKVEEDGTRRGPRTFASSVRPREQDGRVVAWVADATVRVRKHLYLDVYAEWDEKDEPEGCPKGLQSAFWHFHLKARRA